MAYKTPTPYTPRQLRTIADLVEKMTKTRRRAEASGAPVLPDVVALRFPSCHVGVAYWTPADLTSDASREKNNGEAPWRYILDLGPNDATVEPPTRLEGILHVRHGKGSEPPIVLKWMDFQGPEKNHDAFLALAECEET